MAVAGYCQGLESRFDFSVDSEGDPQKPSHLGSYSRPAGALSGVGIPLTALASIGDTGGITGRSTT